MIANANAGQPAATNRGLARSPSARSPWQLVSVLVVEVLGIEDQVRLLKLTG